MKIDVHNTSGEVVGNADLDEVIWNIEPNIAVMPGCYDGLSAKLVAVTGFKVMFMSGFAVSAARLASWTAPSRRTSSTPFTMAASSRRRLARIPARWDRRPSRPAPGRA